MSRFFKVVVTSIAIFSFGLLNAVPQIAGVYGCKIKLEFKVGDKQYLANGTTHSLIVTAPEIKLGKLFLPVKNVTMHIGATLLWQNSSKRLTVTLPYGKIVEFWAGKNKYKVDGDEFSLDASNADVICYILNGSFMAPAKILAEEFSAVEINWDVGKRRFTFIFDDYDCNGAAETPRFSDYNWACLRGNQAHTGEIPAGAGPRGPYMKTLWYAQAGNEEAPPIIVGNRVYITGNSNNFLCLDAETGKALWQASLGTVSSATFHNDKVYVGYWGNVACLNADSGETIWIKKLQTGSNCASPAIVDERLYIPTSIENASIVYCLDIKDGKTIWETRLSYPTCTDILVATGKVFQGTLDGKLHCLDAKTGALIWISNLDAKPIKAPMYLNGKVFVLTDKSLACLDESNGTKVWGFAGKSSLPCAFGGSMLFCSAGKLHKYSFENTPKKEWEVRVNDTGMTISEGKKVYVIGGTKVSCFSAEDGSTNWSTEFNDIGIPSNPTETVIAKGKIFLVYRLYRFFCVGDATTLSSDCNWPTSKGNPWHTGEVGAGCGPKNSNIELLWKSWSGSQTTPVIVGNKVFTVSSTGEMLQCLDIDTGRPFWTKQITAYASMSYSNSLLYVNDMVKLFCIDPETGKELWSKEADTGTTPALHGDLLFVTSPDPLGRITCRNAQDGKVLWTRDFKVPVFTEPLATSGKVFVGCADKSFYCLDAYTGNELWQTILPDKTSPTYQITYFWGDVYIRTVEKKLICMNSNTGETKWTLDGATSNPCVTMAGLFIATNKTLRCLNPDKDYRTRWQRELDSECGGVLSSGDKLYAFGAKYWCLEAQTGELLWEFDPKSLGKNVPSSSTILAMAQEKIFIVKKNNFMYCLGVKE